MKIHLFGFLTKRIARLSCVCLFVGLLCFACECQAQRHRGLFGRGARVHQSQHRNRTSSDSIVENKEAPEPVIQQAPPQIIQQAPPQIIQQTPVQVPYNWRRDPGCYSAYPKYPKYIGGFHSSHFHNLGVPSGDIGFRGNGIYWNPW